MTDAEKVQSLDLPLALMTVGWGLYFLARRKKMAAAAQMRVQLGEITVEEAKRNERLIFWGSCLVTLSGLFVFGMWATGN